MHLSHELARITYRLIKSDRCAGHVNNVTYVRYAESARVNWTRNIGNYIDQAHKKEWLGLVSSVGIGLILRSIKVDYKFVSPRQDGIIHGQLE